MNPVSTEFSPAPPPPFLKIAYIYNGTAALAIILATLLGTFSMVALVALFFCKRIREDYISEEGRRTNLSAESSGLNPRSARSKEENKGLQKDVLDAFPVMMWSEISCKKSSWDCCAVCLGELGEGAGKIRVLPNCGHWFHLECIDTWFFSHSTCPVCRACLAPSIQSSNVSSISNQSSDRRDNISIIPLQISEGTDQSSDRRDRVSARAPSIESSERTDHIAITIE